MGQLIKKFGLAVLFFLRPLLEKTLLRNTTRVSAYQATERDTTSSSMVAEFGLFHRLIFERYFRRVKTVRTDIAMLKELGRKGPIVYVMKNRGQLEYRYFNHLFLKEKIEPIAYANNVFTVAWRPLKRIWQYTIARLSCLYAGTLDLGKTDESQVSTMLAANRNVLINLSISLDYLFGLINTNPLEKVKPLLGLQENTDRPITIVPLQFLYDKQPEQTEKSLFDFLFGEKSRPGALRKFILIFLSLRKQPQAKFGSPIDLKTFLDENRDTAPELLTQKLYQRIEDILSIEHARITGPKLKSKDVMIEEILHDPMFTANLKTISQEDSQGFEVIKKKARAYLNEIAADVNYTAVDFMWLALNYLWNNIFDGLVIKHDQLNRIRDMAGKNPIVLVPMHRSHIDYLLISHIFYAQGITFPHICAGINLNFWPIGKLIRKCGGFFIRRRFEGNHTYKEAFYAYVKALIEQGYCIEFFIEGTRSRTGKLLKPKLGVLAQIMRAYMEGVRDDVYFVPIAVNYDQILEQKTYESEGAGREKSKEDATELLKARKILGKKYGKVYIEFAEPLSLKEFLDKKGITKDSGVERLRSEVEDFGYHLTYHINKVAIVTPISLVAFAILSLDKKTFNFDELVKRIHVLKAYLDFKEVTYSELIHYSDRWAYNEAVQILKSRGLIQEVKTFEENFYTLEGANRAHLDYYKNNILHFFVSLTCFAKIIAQVENGTTITMEHAIRKYELLKKLFENDFTFSSRVTIEEHLRRVMRFCADKGMIHTDDDFCTFTKSISDLNNGEFGAYLGLLDNFLESHLIALRYLKHNRFEGLDIKNLIRDILEKSRPLYLKDDLHHPEALNRFNLENSLKFCASIGLLRAILSDKSRSLYTSTNEVAMIEKWIESVQDFLRLRSQPTTTHPTIVPQPESKLLEGEELH